MYRITQRKKLIIGLMATAAAGLGIVGVTLAQPNPIAAGSPPFLQPPPAMTDVPSVTTVGITLPTSVPAIPTLPKPEEKPAPATKAQPATPAASNPSRLTVPMVPPPVTTASPPPPVLPTVSAPVELPPPMESTLAPKLELPSIPTTTPAQPEQPAKSLQPIMLPQPENDLRPGQPGNSVKEKGPTALPGIPPAPVAPPVATAPTPPATFGQLMEDIEEIRRDLATPPTPSGDSAMKLPARQTVLSAALGLALAAAPTSPVKAQETPPTPMPTQPTQPAPTVLDDLRRDVELLRKDVKQLAETKPATPLADDGLAGRYSALETKVQTLESAIARIEKKLVELDKTTVGASPLTNNPPAPNAPAPALRGTVRLVNEYQTEVSMILNGVSYRLAPGQVQSVTVPSGSYTYELLGAGSKAQTSTVKEGESVTLRIR